MVKIVLVIECQPRINWYRFFADCKLHGVEDIQVEQTTWGDMQVVSYHDRCMVDLRRSAMPHVGTSSENNRTVRPDFILMRSVTRSVGHLDDRNKLYALKHAGIPSVNSLHSCYLALERGWMFGELKELQQKLGKDNFPLVEQTFYASYKQMVISPSIPCVVKIGPYHSGFGKILIKDESQFDDIKGIVAMNDHYATAEPFIEWDYDIRIQKIGPYYRAFARQSPNWKGNVGHVATNEDIPVTPLYKRWVDECAKLMGGLDILALDAVHSKKTGKDYILELNDTAIGLANRYEEEDHVSIRNLVLTRMAEHFPLSSTTSAASPASPATSVSEDGKSETKISTGGDDTKSESKTVSASPSSSSPAVSSEPVPTSTPLVPPSIATGKPMKIAVTTGDADNIDLLKMRLTEATQRATTAEQQAERARRDLAKSQAPGNGNNKCVVQ